MRGGECRSTQWVITATQTCFAACAILNWYSPPTQLVIKQKSLTLNRLSLRIRPCRACRKTCLGGGDYRLSTSALPPPRSEAEFEEFEPRLKYGWFH